MATTLLRRYFVKPGHWEEFLPMWRQVVAIRQRHAFTLLFAYEDREQNLFTWAITHPGDIEAVHARYYADPQRVALQNITDHLASWDIRPVTPVSWSPSAT